jgi:hypothetical protein
LKDTSLTLYGVGLFYGCVTPHKGGSPIKNCALFFLCVLCYFVSWCENDIKLLTPLSVLLKNIYTMKKILSLSVLAIVLSFAAQAQFVIKIRPAAPVVRIRPACPSPRHVWVGGNYNWRGGQYAYTDGYWAVPPAYGHRWIEGHWKNKRRGWVWVPGHWSRF